MAKKKEPSKPVGRFVIPPCSGPNHPHDTYVGAEVMLSAKGVYFAVCPICAQHYFLKNWEHDMGYNVAEAIQLGLQVNLPYRRRLELLRELGLEPSDGFAPPRPPPLPTADGGYRPRRPKKQRK